MKQWIALAALLCCGPCLFAASRSVRPQAGIFIASPFTFEFQGDGLSMMLVVNPLNIPQGSYGPALPHLVPVGAQPSPGSCNGAAQISTVSLSGHLLTVNFSAPPPEGEVLTCTVYLLFNP